MLHFYQTIEAYTLLSIVPYQNATLLHSLEALATMHYQSKGDWRNKVANANPNKESLFV